MRTKCSVIIRAGDGEKAAQEMLKKALMRELRNHPGAEKVFAPEVRYTVSKVEGVGEQDLIRITAELKRKERRSEGRG